MLLHLRVFRCCRWKRFSWLMAPSLELKPLLAEGPSVQSWWLSRGKVHCFWPWQLLCQYTQVMLQQFFILTWIFEWKHKRFVWCPSQTWNWTVGLIMWCWCGRRAEHRLTPHSFGWVTVFPPVFRARRPFSVWMSTVVTSGDWWVILLSAKWESTMHLWAICLSHRLLGISCCTPMICDISPLLTLKFCLSVTLLSVHTRGGCAKLKTGACFQSSTVLLIYCFILYRPKDWYPLIYDPEFDTYGQADLVFSIGLMNGGCLLKCFNKCISEWIKYKWLIHSYNDTWVNVYPPLL